MLFLTHLLFGLFLGRLTGNIVLVVIGSTLVDMDHIYVFIKKGILFHPVKLWTSMSSPHDPYGSARTIVHSLFGWAALTLAVSFVNIGYASFISIGYLSHLVLDAIDSDDLRLMFPLRWNIKGPIVYNSIAEHILCVILFCVLFLSL